jgi:hypothetical protein
MRGLALAALLMTMVFAGAAQATYFELDPTSSSVTLTDQSGGGFVCRMTSCGIEANLASDFGGGIELNEGESWSFDFIEFSATGSTGFLGRSFDIVATLAFSSPTGIDTTIGGEGVGFFISGVITGGALSWNQDDAWYVLADGTRVRVAFQDGVTILPLDQTVVTKASVGLFPGVSGTSPVPEPGAALLFAAGIAVVAEGQRRRVR